MISSRCAAVAMFGGMMKRTSMGVPRFSERVRDLSRGPAGVASACFDFSFLVSAVFSLVVAVVGGLPGGAAGLAGALEVAGPIGQLTPYVPAGYGFAAIIVAFVGRLHPLGMVLSALLMSMFYIGGELAQSRLGLPKSITGVFQGLLLFCLLACDTLVAYRIRWGTGLGAARKGQVA